MIAAACATATQLGEVGVIIIAFVFVVTIILIHSIWDASD